MATLGILIGGAIANAVAFTGGQAIYHAVEKGPDPEVERERHDKALEALSKANNEWNHKRQETLDYVNRRLRREGQAERDFEDVDEALALYRRTHPDLKPTWGKKPTLSDFYEPSETQKAYEYAFIIGGTMATGLLLYKFM